jgi:hypothetical protein
VISSTIISIPILSIFALSMMTLIKSTGHPLSLYGFTTQRGLRSAVESILYCIPLLAIVIAAKWLAISFLPAFQHLTLFHISPALASDAPPASPLVFALLVGTYALFVPIQEFIFRGAIQSSLDQFLSGKNKTLQAILISNLPFSMIHWHLSFSVAVTTYFYGLVLGFIFARQKTLIGCCINHFIFGIWAFFIVGFQDLLIV